MYYDFDGNPITLEEWAALTELKRAPRANDYGASTPEDDPTRVGWDSLECDVIVSTVWIGLDMGFPTGLGQHTPIIYETMIFGGEHADYTERYATREAALKGHREACRLAFGTEGV